MAKMSTQSKLRLGLVASLAAIIFGALGIVEARAGNPHDAIRKIDHATAGLAPFAVDRPVTIGARLFTCTYWDDASTPSSTNSTWEVIRCVVFKPKKAPKA
jgi:hypothetical protein